MRQREPRYRVRMKGRMRSERGWADVAIQNVSVHGMLVRAVTPPPPGSYVEISAIAEVIVARAVWSEGGLCGVRTQDPIDLARFKAMTPTTAALAPPNAGERLRRGLAAAGANGERNRQRARLAQFAAILFAVVGAAALLATALHGTLAAPFDAIRAKLPGAAPPEP